MRKYFNIFKLSVVSSIQIRERIKEETQDNNVIGLGKHTNMVSHSLRGTSAQPVADIWFPDKSIAKRTGHLCLKRTKSIRIL